MAKRATPFDLMLPERPPDAPAYRWLYEAVRTEILEGRLRPGARLPGTRDLGQRYGLSRGTIVSAFDQLRAEGYVEGSVGSGTYVSRVLPDELLQVPSTARTQGGSVRRPRRHFSDYGKAVRPFSMLELRRSYAFRPNMPDVESFPTELWAQLAARRLRRVTASQLTTCEPLGYRPLREAVADYLTTSRGVTCMSEQVVIVSGVQEALDMTARLFVQRGDRVCVEDPGYEGAIRVFEAAGARIAAIPVDDEGLKLEARRLRGSRLVYVTPAHQYPLGITMSLPRRLALLEWAHMAEALIFEDDYDSEFRYAGRPVPALQGLDRAGSVLFAGTFNKVLFPSLRLGYLVVPADLVERFEALRSVATRHPSPAEQAVVCDFITEGHFGRHLRRMREIYAERLSALMTEARQRLAGLLEISDVEAGLQTVGWLAASIDGESAARAAAQRKVEVTPLSRFCRLPMAREGLQLGFSAVDTREIRRGVRELAIALETLTRPLLPYAGP
jgi:GntR family transcriptional regulator/MocR family aminotransferase